MRILPFEGFAWTIRAVVGVVVVAVVVTVVLALVVNGCLTKQPEVWFATEAILKDNQQ